VVRRLPCRSLPQSGLSTFRPRQLHLQRHPAIGDNPFTSPGRNGGPMAFANPPPPPKNCSWSPQSLPLPLLASRFERKLVTELSGPLGRLRTTMSFCPPCGVPAAVHSIAYRPACTGCRRLRCRCAILVAQIPAPALSLNRIRRRKRRSQASTRMTQAPLLSPTTRHNFYHSPLPFYYPLLFH
jgi:hypothetical protein